jgi:hypothetical protein
MIAFYISCHGFGHLTRSLVHIEEYLKKEEEIYIVCGKKQIDFARQYLEKYSEKLIFKVLETDIGLINKENSLEIDKNKLEKKLIEFINSWEEIVVKEIDFLRSKNLEKIITDISPIGMLIGKKLGVKVIAISNFTWYNQYLYLKLDKFILDKFLEAENFINEFYMYPLSLNLSHINCKKEKIGYVAREFNIKKINELRNKYKEIIFISCGKSANLEKIQIKNYKGTIFYTDGIEIIGEGQHIKLPIETEDTHNYVGASDFIISKAGWGTVAEAILSKVPMVLLERDGVLEDSYTINELKNQKKAVSIKVEELKVLDIENLKKNIRNISRGKTRVKE